MGASAFCVSLAAPLPIFGEVAPVAFDGLTKLVSQVKSGKKKDLPANVALDNAISALFKLLIHQKQHCPDVKATWELVISKLPLKFDEEETQKVNKELLQLVVAQNPDVLGPNNANLGKLLGIFAEVYATDLADKETQDGIRKAFKAFPQSMLQGLASQFSEKHQKRIMKILS